MASKNDMLNLTGNISDDDDADESFCSTVPCNYISVKDLNDFVLLPHANNSINIMHINCRSIPKNFDTMLELFHIMTAPIDFLAVTETWLKPASEQLYNIPGFSLATQSRLSKQGGGVGIYIATKYFDYPIVSLSCAS